ncbi:MAG: FAD-dependent oxidoreductase, partial [Solirubrobacterales bacterium]
MADDGFDLIVVGGGPGGYVAAIRAAQLGLNTAVVERDKVGGRCLNYACIPAKTMLHTAEVLEEAKNGAHLGVKTEGVELDWKALSDRRAEVSAGLESGIEMLFKKNGITVIEGEASLTAEGDVEVDGKTYTAGKVILATGSVAMPIPGTEFSDRVVDTWGGWSLPEQPTKIAVAGAGASGAEIASAYIRYGTDVILV